MLADATLLVYPVSNAPVAIFADASDLGIDGVLQVQIEGVWSPVAFFPRRLNDTQHSGGFRGGDGGDASPPPA